MNWKSLLYTMVGVLLALVVWEMFVKKLVPASGYEGETRQFRQFRLWLY